ncbi:uncharacterized protein STEHIDRAFT_160730 [Stereum hirsutum FP-91666 SS1]|uniref:uncharacterized protein n=1 Tax=Stereum hirsutum (strain FP-91666) TaxID=721885 RepID=UPI0004449B09|nr:uncharacterized protein STEHIDRAFT_160730 [Stereum hirsutum FP-91666 SS1]EIM83131.1 hypothetical protein STEHIDRAFT_160730 [Stereum hirsutum FP-91666 SS1]
MGYRDKGKGIYMDEFLQPNPNPKPGELRTVPQWPHKRLPQPQPTDSLSAPPSHQTLRPIHAEADEHKALQPPISPCLKPAVITNEGTIRLRWIQET